MPNETIEAMIKLVPALPDSTVQDLLELLRYDLARGRLSTASPASRLGLLSTLLTQRGGEIPNVIAYDQHRRLDSADWPSGSQLARDYGGWLRAVRASAMLAAGESPTRRVSAGAGAGGRYTQHEARLALLACRKQIGSWPATQSEYAQWSKLARSVQNRWGKAPARIPTAKTLIRLFGSFGFAVTHAKRLM